MIADAVGPTARVGVAGCRRRARESSPARSRRLASRVSRRVANGRTLPNSAEALAAHFAGSEVGPVLRSEDAVARRRARTRARSTWMIAGAAAALFVVAAAVELWGVHHQLDVVREERARIRPQIASTMVGRTTVDAAYRHLTALDAVERTAPQWSSVIATRQRIRARRRVSHGDPRP